MLYLWTDGVDTVVAADAEHAERVWTEYVGEPWEPDNGPWRQVPNETSWTVTLEDPNGEPVTVTRPAREWANDGEGPGFLCSMEF